jgi:type IV pilus assembly protein PilN
MIRINLLAVDRERTKKTRVVISPAHRVTMGATLVLIVTVLGLGWWFWSLRTESIQLDESIARAEMETQQLRTLLAQVQTFEARKAQLQQRVTLIEQLRKGQAAPVHVLDEISRTLPDRLWLAEMKQTGSEFTLVGFATTMTALSDFVGAIESTKWFQKPVELIDSQVTSDSKAGDLVRFAVKATFHDPDAPNVFASGKDAKKR